MADNRQYMALEWVIRDIKETLLQAQSALDDYARESADVIPLKFCVTYIHQVYGSLHMAGFHGAAMIASEAEALAQNLLDGKVMQPKEATEVLTKAIAQLSDYLDHALKEKCDQPSLVFLLLNDLRAVRGAQFLSESALFSPSLEYAHTVHGEPHQILDDEQQFVTMLKKLREMYQYAAASVMHKTKVAENLRYLSKVSQRLEKILQGSLRVALWEIVSAFLSGVDESVIAESVSIKKLFRQLDEELQQLIDHGVDALNEKTSDEFLKNWLYYLSSLENSNDAIDCIVERYALQNASLLVHEDNKTIRPIDSSAMRAVAQAIVDEFSEVKTILVNSHADEQLPNDLAFIRSAFQRAADTLAILSVNALRQEMLVNIARIDQLKSYNEEIFPASQLSVIEASIADIENELEASLLDSQTANDASDRVFDAGQEEALQESRNGLEEAKDAVVNYIATQWNIKNLQPVPHILRDVVAHLTVLSFQVPAEILTACAHYIETKLINQPDKPKWEQLDSLADVIASIDYFLEVFLLTQEEDHAILEGAEQGLRDLGVSYHAKNQAGSMSSNDGMVELNESDVDALLDGADSEAVAPNIAEKDDDAIDAEAAAEIIEIFTEEAEEVQATIAEYLPLWAAGFTDENALIEVRRGFHTLKGSGRLVKASDIGELSWSIENLLNRVLDKTLKPEKIQIDIIKKALELLPPMVEAFSQQRATPNALLCEQCKLWAHELAQGEASTGLHSALNTSDAQSVPHAPEFMVDDEDDDIDVQLWEIFGAESETHLAAVRQYISQMEAVRPFFEMPSDTMQRAMHTIKGSAHMAEITPIAQLMTPMELFVKDLRAYQVVIDEDILQLIKDSVSYTEDALEQMSRLMFPTIEKLELFLARVAELRERSVGHLISHEDENLGPKVDPAFLEMLMNEGMNLLLDIDPLINAWRSSPATVSDWQPIADELVKVQHGAERANLGSMVVMSQTLHQQYEHLIHGRIQASDHIYDVMLDTHYALLDIIDAIAGGQDLPEADANLIAQLNAFVAANEATDDVVDEAMDIVDIANDDIERQNATHVSSETENDVAIHHVESVSDIALPEEETQDLTADHQLSIDDATANDESTVSSIIVDEEVALSPEVNDELDEEVVAIFMEEAAELIEEMDDVLQDLEEGSEGRDVNEGMQRILHTFKGGARLAGLTVLGDLAHDFESYLIAHYYEAVSATLIDDIHQYQDQLIVQLESVSQAGVLTVESTEQSDVDTALIAEAPVSEQAGEGIVISDHLNDDVDHDLSDNVVEGVLTEDVFVDGVDAENIFDEDVCDEHASITEKLIADIEHELNGVKNNTDACNSYDNILHQLNDVKHTASTAGTPLVFDAAQQFESYILRHYYETVSPELIGELQQYKERLLIPVKSENDTVGVALSTDIDVPVADESSMIDVPSIDISPAID
jgi:chemosensory pili system protein ChpA (sensor histidine kinase/response regulator)